MEIRREYERICPMTIWSDEELLEYLHKQRITALKENKESSLEITKVDSIEKYINKNKCKYAEDVINEFREKKCD